MPRFISAANFRFTSGVMSFDHLRCSTKLRRLPQFRVLLWRKLQPNSTDAFPDCFLKFLSTGNVQREAATLCHLEHLVFIGNRDLTRERRFEVLFKELAEPALPKHEVHVDALFADVAAVT